MGGVSNINKAKGHSREKMRRMARSAKESNRRIQPSVTTTRVMTKMKQKQLEKAIRYEKKILTQKGLINYEEDMKDVAVVDPGRQRVIAACISSDDVLQAAASGPETTLGGPQQL
ncbi:hypothetical protein G6F46_012718 [Rhizopus delemar]|uniref:Uncharacterized protein n=3 Tax=Rhizopus TaxID=4842 RepID=I1CKR6_RHIO9|nr:hypothetical protein RO3G_13757 [Rhizopus delemar RA 99-880]KAG1443703.1 hypothetical protein G6F55_012578 [Rhizopus delemar]KAG1532967.1 hypothetical protein G6F51_012851 [Rhizopus arrhizus]KAG1487487.1 hypothetical protein G6F54_012626 [Rhizopus delemar]KAG1489846.1 hypothetical protein G6F52_013679 [Rhizopus delemar]|eukprot:EIE89046.1 hypothetical protein RO3G_13757 [Rhizopus delemar RA 99-880]